MAEDYRSQQLEGGEGDEPRSSLTCLCSICQCKIVVQIDKKEKDRKKAVVLVLVGCVSIVYGVTLKIVAKFVK